MNIFQMKNSLHLEYLNMNDVGVLSAHLEHCSLLFRYT